MPQLFIGGYFFGGYDDTQRKDEDGRLVKELERAGALVRHTRATDRRQR